MKVHRKCLDVCLLQIRTQLLNRQHCMVLFYLYQIFINYSVYGKMFQVKVVYLNEMYILCHVPIVFTTIQFLEEL